MHAGLIAQAIQLQRQLRGRALGELQRHGTCLGLQLAQHLVDRRLTERHAAFERGIDLDIEPGLDAAHQKLHRNGVDEGSGHYGHEREQKQEPQRQA